MATINFPQNPTTDDTFLFGGRTWLFNGKGWVLTTLVDSSKLLSAPGVDLYDGAVKRSQLLLVEGDTWLLANAYWDPVTAEFYRVDRTKAAFGMQLQGYGTIPGEAELGFSIAGISQWVALPAQYDMIKGGGVSTGGRYSEAGAWSLASTMTQERQLTLGGAGIEIDGYGTLPYGRVQHATVGTHRNTGILVNAFNDESGRDDPASPSWSFGVDQTNAGESFKIRYAAGGGTGIAWQDIFSINSAGVFSGPALDGKANAGGSNAYGNWNINILGKAAGLNFPDTRGSTPTPADVQGYHVGFEFKAMAEVGNPPVNAGNGYAWIQTLHGWSSDGSGGWPIQLSWSGAGYAVRQGTSATTWGAWKDTTGAGLYLVQVAGTAQTAVAGAHYEMSNAALSTVTLPAAATGGDALAVTFTNGLKTNVILSNGLKIRGAVQDINPVDLAGTINFKYISTAYGWEVSQ